MNVSVDVRREKARDNRKQQQPGGYGRNPNDLLAPGHENPLAAPHFLAALRLITGSSNDTGAVSRKLSGKYSSRAPLLQQAAQDVY
jgi:hypothetical protein